MSIYLTRARDVSFNVTKARIKVAVPIPLSLIER